MSRSLLDRWLPILTAVLLAPWALVDRAWSLEERTPAPGSGASWQPPTLDEVRTQFMTWLDATARDPTTRRRAAELWTAAAAPADADPLARLVQSFALVDPRSAKLVEICSKPHADRVLVKQDWLTDRQTSPFLARNLRLWYGRWLARELLFDEAEQQLTGLEPRDVADPAALLFYQAVVYHRLLKRDQGLQAIDRLLQRGPQSPRRYVAVARLMRADLENLKEDTLDHIARRMEDVRRRLDLGQTGPRVIKVEDGVIASLDKLIKELEDQEKKQQQQGVAGSNMTPSSPAPESRILTGKGAGDVNKRNIGNKSGWGNLPPKEREEALQQIGREFPSHYRDVVEQYFRRLANQAEEKEK
jgi:hypothetical protein